VYRIWKQEGLKVPVKKRKKRRLGDSSNASHRRRAEHPNHVWSWDFVFDRTVHGKLLKWLTIVDEFTRENLCLEVKHHMTSEDVINYLADLFQSRGLPSHIRSDNGPELIAKSIQDLLGKLNVETFTLNQAALGRTRMQRASTVVFETSFSRWKYSTT
jgi:transposase InsO family protein